MELQVGLRAGLSLCFPDEFDLLVSGILILGKTLRHLFFPVLLDEIFDIPAAQMCRKRENNWAGIVSAKRHQRQMKGRH